MPTIHRTLVIGAPAEAIWAIVSDPKRAAHWMPDITERDVRGGGPLQLGAQWREQGLLRGRGYSTMYEITAWEPTRRMSYQRLSAATGDYHWIETVAVDPHVAGASVTLSLEYAMPGGLIGKLYERFLFRKDFAGTLDNRLERLKEVAENAHEPAPPAAVESPGETAPKRRIKRAVGRKED